MAVEQASRARLDPSSSPKHRPGGLVDIEFVAQLGVLTSARLYPRVIRATGTATQIEELAAIGWLNDGQAGILQTTMALLREQKLMQALVGKKPGDATDTSDSAGICDEKLGRTGSEVT